MVAGEQPNSGSDFLLVLFNILGFWALSFGAWGLEFRV